MKPYWLTQYENPTLCVLWVDDEFLGEAAGGESELLGPLSAEKRRILEDRVEPKDRGNYSWLPHDDLRQLLRRETEDDLLYEWRDRLLALKTLCEDHGVQAGLVNFEEVEPYLADLTPAERPAVILDVQNIFAEAEEHIPDYGYELFRELNLDADRIRFATRRTYRVYGSSQILATPQDLCDRIFPHHYLSLGSKEFLANLKEWFGSLLFHADCHVARSLRVYNDVWTCSAFGVNGSPSLGFSDLADRVHDEIDAKGKPYQLVRDWLGLPEADLWTDEVKALVLTRYDVRQADPDYPEQRDLRLQLFAGPKSPRQTRKLRSRALSAACEALDINATVLRGSEFRLPIRPGLAFLTALKTFIQTGLRSVPLEIRFNTYACIGISEDVTVITLSLDRDPKAAKDDHREMAYNRGDLGLRDGFFGISGYDPKEVEPPNILEWGESSRNIMNLLRCRTIGLSSTFRDRADSVPALQIFLLGLAGPAAGIEFGPSVLRIIWHSETVKASTGGT